MGEKNIKCYRCHKNIVKIGERFHKLSTIHDESFCLKSGDYVCDDIVPRAYFICDDCYDIFINYLSGHPISEEIRQQLTEESINSKEEFPNLWGNWNREGYHE